MKNIVFDLGGVVFARDHNKCSAEFLDFFAFVHADPMPEFWNEYDRGSLTVGEVVDIMCRIKNCTPDVCKAHVQEAIDKQEAIVPTERLIADLKNAGYNLYVLSNMSAEFIEYLRRIPVYEHFDGEVISCEEHTVKPEPEIYRILLSRYGIYAAETMFIDDRQANLDVAASFGFSTFLFNRHFADDCCDKLRRKLLNVGSTSL